MHDENNDGGGGGAKMPPPPNGIRVKRQIKVWQWFTTRGSYVHDKPMVKFGEASRKCYFFCVQYFLKILTVSDKTFTRLLEFIKLYKQNPLENFFIFTI